MKQQQNLTYCTLALPKPPALFSHTFSLLQLLDLLQHWLDIQKEPMAVAEELQQVP